MRHHWCWSAAAGQPMVLACFVAVLCIGLCCCAARHSQAPGSVRLYSPAGEPLNGGALGEPSCADALSAWFERVDSDHGGTIDRGEFLAMGGGNSRRWISTRMG